MDELAVAGERLGRQSRIVQPGGPAARELADLVEAVRAESPGDAVRVVRGRAVDDDRSVRAHAVRGEPLDDLAALERLEPRRRERGGAGDVAARHAVHGPAVVSDQRPDVDDGDPARGEGRVELVRRDRLVRLRPARLVPELMIGEMVMTCPRSRSRGRIGKVTGPLTGRACGASARLKPRGRSALALLGRAATGAPVNDRGPHREPHSDCSGSRMARTVPPSGWLRSGTGRCHRPQARRRATSSATQAASRGRCSP